MTNCRWLVKNPHTQKGRGRGFECNRLITTTDAMSENGGMLLELTKDELGIINNALNEVCNGVDLEGEFDTRMGCTVEEARAVLAKVHALASSE